MQDDASIQTKKWFDMFKKEKERGLIDEAESFTEWLEWKGWL